MADGRCCTPAGLQVKSAPGFLAELLQIAASDAVDPGVRQAGSIYFKNVVRIEWNMRDGTSNFSEEEKQLVRDNLLESLILAPPLVRTQMALALTTIAHTDFPANWPGLFPAVMANIKSGEEQRMMGALVALRRLGKRFEFAKDQADARDKMVAESFPVLLDLWKHLLSS
eukprot:COSAG02_NODE_25025_length_670_cov_578.394046_1_plen_169_part_10